MAVRVARPPTRPPCYFFWVGGQSVAWRPLNAAVTISYDLGPYAVRRATVGFFEQIDVLHDQGPGVELGICDYLSDQNATVCILKGAVSGINMDDWLANVLPDMHADDSFREGPTDFFWVHGEDDSVTQVFADAYETKLNTMAASVWAAHPLCRIHVTDNGPLPIGSFPYKATVDAAKASFAASDSRVYLVDRSTVTYQVDNIHPDEAGNREMGRLLAASAIAAGAVPS